MCPADNNGAAADGKAVLIKRRRWRGHEKKKGRKMERIDLNGLWTMNPTDRKAEYPAKIPGSVLSALLDAEAIPNPYYRRNEYRARELFRKITASEGNFRWRKRFFPMRKLIWSAWDWTLWLMWSLTASRCLRPIICTGNGGSRQSLT